MDLANLYFFYWARWLNTSVRHLLSNLLCYVFLDIGILWLFIMSASYTCDQVRMQFAAMRTKR